MVLLTITSVVHKYTSDLGSKAFQPNSFVFTLIGGFVAM